MTTAGGSYLDQVRERAFERLRKIMEAASQRLQAPPPAQDDLRAIFDQLAAQTDPELFEMGYEALVERYGEQEVERQLSLLVRRRTSGEVSDG